MAARITHADKVKFALYVARYGALGPWRQHDYPAAMLVQYMCAVAGSKPPDIGELMPYLQSGQESPTE